MRNALCQPDRLLPTWEYMRVLTKLLWCPSPIPMPPIPRCCISSGTSNCDGFVEAPTWHTGSIISTTFCNEDASVKMSLMRHISKNHPVPLYSTTIIPSLDLIKSSTYLSRQRDVIPTKNFIVFFRICLASVVPFPAASPAAASFTRYSRIARYSKESECS